MKVRFYLNRTSRSGETPIFCYLLERNQSFTLNTMLTIDRKYWDKTLQRANINTKNNILKSYLKKINGVIDSFEIKLKEIELDLLSTDPTADFDEKTDAVKKYFNKKDLYTIFDEFIDKNRARVSPKTIYKYKRLKSLLIEYESHQNEKLNIKKITKKPFIYDFFNYLIISKNQLNSSAYKNVQFLKAFLNWSFNHDYHNNLDYTKLRRNDLVKESEEHEVIYLSENELMTLYNMDLIDGKLDRVRDIFLFQCFTGVRYSDLKRISRDDIKNGVWQVRTQKTRQILSIPLNSYAISILAKYSEFPQPLPIITNQKMNDYLKELCELAGFDSTVKTVNFQGNKRIEKKNKKYEVVGTHTARRTFISLSLQKGMKPDVIMAITGHSTYRMMQKYLKIADQHKRDEMDRTWGSPLRLAKGDSFSNE